MITLPEQFGSSGSGALLTEQLTGCAHEGIE